MGEDVPLPISFWQEYIILGISAFLVITPLLIFLFIVH